ncbi:hypothetical protein [Geobacter sp. AOG1]|nr:hypothetical protein [Geobacter sp. AOG1]
MGRLTAINYRFLRFRWVSRSAQGPLAPPLFGSFAPADRPALLNFAYIG